MSLLKVFTDGGARGNPGPAAHGFVVFDDQDRLLAQSNQYLGVKTNNEAEYSGLIAALNWLCSHYSQYQFTQVNFYLDSQLIVRQVQGLYKIKAPHLQHLNDTALSLIKSLPSPVTFFEIPRSQNQLADRLVNQSLDEKHP